MKLTINQFEVLTSIERNEKNLIASPAMNGIHIMDKSLHRLVYTAYRAVDNMLYNPSITA